MADYTYERDDLETGEIEYRILEGQREVARVLDVDDMQYYPESSLIPPLEMAKIITSNLNKVLRSRQKE